MSHKSKAESHSPFTSIQILSPTVENIPGVKLYICLGDLTKMAFKMKKNPTLEKSLIYEVKSEGFPGIMAAWKLVPRTPLAILISFGD